MEEKKAFFKSLRLAIYFLSFFASFFIFTGATAKAASLYFSPASGKFDAGNIFTVSVLVNTQSAAINNAEATVNFPAEFLSVISVSQSNSIFSLWPQSVVFSNSAGTISFNGGLPTPGFNGSSGKIFSAVFRVKKAGTASLVFSGASVRANDGKGTDVLSSVGSAQFTLGAIAPTSEPKLTPTPAQPNTPAAPVISSPTHPDENKWYSEKDVVLIWSLPTGIKSDRVLFSKLFEVVPTITYTPPISSKTLANIEDGIWYFLAQLRNANGWGQIGNFKVQIDTQKPNINIQEVPREDLAYPKVKFFFSASDSRSGIDYYNVLIDNLPSQVWRDDGSHIYETQALDPGRHVIIAKVFDKAGNSLTDSLEFNISSINPPKITDYTDDLTAGQRLFIKGLSYPDAEVTVWFQKDKGEPKKQVMGTDKDGVFSTIFEEKVEEGVYSVWAEVRLKDAKSGPGNKITTGVRQPTFLRIGSWLISFLAVSITLMALIILLFLLLWYAWYKYRHFKTKIKEEIESTNKTVHRAFDDLRENMRKQIGLLEKVKLKRDLTREENRILLQLKNQLNNAELSIRTEIEKIERDVE